MKSTRNTKKIANRLTATGLACITALTIAGCTTSSDDAAPDASNPSGSGDTQVVTLLKQGIEHAQAQKFDQATTTFNNVLAIDPTNKYAHYNLGLIAQTKKDANAAIAQYDKAISADANFTPALYNKAIAVEATDPDAAIGMHENIVKIDDKASTAYYRLFLAYTKKGDAKKAQEAKAKALALDPTLAQQPTASPTASPTAIPTASPSTTK